MAIFPLAKEKSTCLGFGKITAGHWFKIAGKTRRRIQAFSTYLPLWKQKLWAIHQHNYCINSFSMPMDDPIVSQAQHILFEIKGGDCPRVRPGWSFNLNPQWHSIMELQSSRVQKQILSFWSRCFWKVVSWPLEPNSSKACAYPSLFQFFTTSISLLLSSSWWP